MACQLRLIPAYAMINLSRTNVFFRLNTVHKQHHHQHNKKQSLHSHFKKAHKHLLNEH